MLNSPFCQGQSQPLRSGPRSLELYTMHSFVRLLLQTFTAGESTTCSDARGRGDRLRWGAPRPATGRGQERHADARPQSRAASQASPLGKPGRSVLPGGEHPQGGGRRHPGAPGLAEGAPACRRKAEIHNIDGSGPGGEGWRDLVPLEKRSWAGWGGVCFRETL